MNEASTSYEQAADKVSGASAVHRRPFGTTDIAARPGTPVHDQNKLSGIE